MRIRNVLAGIALCALFGFGVSQIASAQTVTCSNIESSPTDWPSANIAKTCSGSGTPAYSDILRSTLESLGAYGEDFSTRLQTAAITPSDVISITVTDSTLSGGSTIVSHTTTSTDSLYTIAADLANQIANLNSHFYGYASSNTANFGSDTGSTTYSASTSSGANETISLSNDGMGNETATLGGSPRSNITWYEFANHSDYYNSSTANGGPSIVSTGLGSIDLGNSTLDTSGAKATEVFESTSADGSLTNSVVAHVTAHETGHDLDKLYADYLPTKVAQLTGSSATAGDTISITVSNSGLGGTETVTYTVQSGDDLDKIAQGLAAAINDDNTLKTIGVSAAAGPVTAVYITSTSSNSTSYSGSTSTGATETITTTGLTTNFSDSAMFRTALAFDLKMMNMVPVCTFDASDGMNGIYSGGVLVTPLGGYYASSGGGSPNSTGGLSGLFSGLQDSNAGPICGSDGYGRSLNSPYSGNALNVITGGSTAANAAFPIIHPTNAAEMFAEEFAELTGFTDLTDNSGSQVAGSDAIFSGNTNVSFACTTQIVAMLAIYGRLATSDDLDIGYTIPDGPMMSGVDAGFYGTGSTLYSCNGSTTHGNYHFGA